MGNSVDQGNLLVQLGILRTLHLVSWVQGEPSSASIVIGTRYVLLSVMGECFPKRVSVLDTDPRRVASRTREN